MQKAQAKIDKIFAYKHARYLARYLGDRALTYVTLTTPRDKLDSSACATLIAQTLQTLKTLERCALGD